MLRSLTVEQLGRRIRVVDQHLLRTVAHRMGLAVSVGARKRADDQPIFRRQVENMRLDEARIEGRKLGINEGFAEALLYMLIGEACKLQMIHLQDEAYEPLPDTKDDEEWFQVCRRNLLALTEHVAPIYDQEYESGFTASGAYRVYEERVIDEQVNLLGNRRLAIDLGCATGKQSLRLASRFDLVRGFDISPHMVDVARRKAVAHSEHVQFDVSDLEHSIPVKDGAASFVFANFGAASDLRNIQKLIVEIERVLEPRGRYLLSFYNADALVYSWDFLPWAAGLAAEINEEVNCLDVHVGSNTYPIFARTYRPSDVRHLLAGGALKGPSMRTFPTISALLPSELLVQGNDKAKDVLTKLDLALDTQEHGAYILATGEKTV